MYTTVHFSGTTETVDLLISNQKVEGSSPAGCTKSNRPLEYKLPVPNQNGSEETD